MNLKFIRIIDRYIGIPLCYALHWIDALFKLSKKKGDKTKIDKILMIKFWGIGNLVMLLPTIKAIRQHYPNAQLDMFTLLQNRQVFYRNSFIDNIHLLSNKNLLSFVSTFMKAVFQLRRKRYDMILDFEQFAKISSVFALLIRGQERIGFDTPGQGRGIAYTRKVAYLDFTHMVETFFRIAKGAGVDKADLSPLKLHVEEAERKRVELFFQENGIGKNDFLVGVHIGSGDNMMAQRRWEIEKFAQLTDMLIDRHKLTIIFTGAGKDESKLVERTVSLMKNRSINAVNQLSLKELAFLIEQCRFFISNDTAPVHIASAMKTPVVAFFGPNTPYLYGPRGKNDLVFYRDLFCSPCITNYNAKIHKCDHSKCMKAIIVEEVLEGIEKKYFAKNSNSTIETRKLQRSADR